MCASQPDLGKQMNHSNDNIRQHGHKQLETIADVLFASLIGIAAAILLVHHLCR